MAETNVNQQFFLAGTPDENIKNSTNLSLTPDQLLQLGTSKLIEISKTISNPFWKQVLSAAHLVSEGMLFTYPSKVTTSPIFYNPRIVRKKVLKPRDFPEIDPNVTVAHFLHPGTNELMDWEDFCVRYNSRISQIKFTDIRYISYPIQ